MDSVNKTLYIPLYGKAVVSRKGLFLRDEMAETIWEKEGFPLKGKAKSRWLAYNMGMRSALFDRWLAEKMVRNPQAVVLHLGCGMDSRVTRVGMQGHRWFDVDFPEVIVQREKYFSPGNGYAMIASDLREQAWLEKLPRGTAIVVMEGVSMYLTGPERLELLQRLTAHFHRIFLLMDVYTVFGAKASRFKNPINTLGVTTVFGVASPGELTEGTGLCFAKEHDLTPEAMIQELPRQEQRIFRTLFAGGLAKKIYRLYEYESQTPPT